ncbi:hypothetical protein TanjilG_30040 [Lupinus angustifolius]|uniref:Hydroxyproline-rich glycoprotein family protein n=1 Tax=Lupinus angustifolius TaxID=3871 RepID=A0A4P1R6V6_LUPAN|nr:PREDICTED: YLP motif-containing protein 1-like [Lupinus angustifolius]OIW03764.1 hypothetical protein TanjilG_30040 [Lupinus angustifolius]
MEEEKDTMPPFWMQDGSANGRRLSRTNSLFFNSGALLIFLLVTALAFIFILAPTLHSFTSYVFKPHTVKRTWDSLNLVLVLFAILCGFLSRNNNNNTNEETPRSYSYQEQNFSVSDKTQDYIKPNPETETQRSWYEYEYSDRTGYSYKSFNRLRSINSYPDLRQESTWVNSDERWRFYDDTHVNGYQERRPRPVTGEEELVMKTLEVDTFEVSKKEVSSAPQLLPAVEPPPPPPRGKEARRKGKGTYQAVGKVKNHDLGAKRSQPPPPSTPPPPPPPPPPLVPTEKTVKEKNRSKSATKEFLASLKGKKKKQRHRSLENFESILNYSKPHTLPSQLPPPPPPPPPSPPPVFESLFSSKKRKHKKPDISSPKIEPVNGATTLKPRPRESFYTLKENVSAANESPLNIPIPPPPPPFKLPAWKFKVKGGFVRIDSNSSTSSDLPDLEVVESPKESSEVNQCNSNDSGELEILLFYPSPDVDTKANTFIEKFRAGLRMEKMNSTKSNLGPSINTETKEDVGPSSRYKADYVL